MSNTETRAEVHECPTDVGHDPHEIQRIEPKNVQLGPDDALKVRRTLPVLILALVFRKRLVSGLAYGAV